MIQEVPIGGNHYPKPTVRIIDKIIPLCRGFYFIYAIWSESCVFIGPVCMCACSWHLMSV